MLCRLVYRSTTFHMRNPHMLSMHSSRLRKRAWRHCLRIALPVSLLALGACDQERDGVPTRPVAQTASKAVSPTAPATRPEEAGFSELANVVASSGGFFFDNRGRLIVVVRDTVEFRNAPTAISSLIGRGKISLSPEKPGNPQIILRRGDFTFRQLAAWRDMVSDYVDNTPNTGVVSLDLDEAVNRVVVGALPSASTDGLLARFTSAGIDPKALVFHASQPMKFLSETGRRSATVSRGALSGTSVMTLSDIRQSAPTMIGGIYVGIVWSGGQLHPGCTLGLPGLHNGLVGCLTAYHCTERLFSFDGDGFTQPANGSPIGQENHDPAYYLCGLFKCRPMDATFVATNPGISVGLGLIAWPANPATDDPHSYDPSNLAVVTQTEAR